ncbi:hypothetical protein HFO74_29365 [Rhizobium laguerreae]|uniref:Uncharacterized protein n=1 Tax=Rhizobium laguerreae TaxID=1076926 RepID=A0AB35FKZ7_9HYPH|nr:hypothetical protein [Rhizobium laguerreae]MBY3067482.1 hypothetical protein [Rhizobium laguerreae]
MNEASLKHVFSEISKLRGGAASSLLASGSMYSGSFAKDFLSPFDYWTSLAATVGAYIGFILLVIIAVKGVFVATTPIGTEPSTGDKI